MKRNKMKRKRRDLCPSPILDEVPKRTKVHAQRKFAQGSSLNSPVITPVKEFERVDRSTLDLTPEPVELLPIRRPNTEDFLTFLCFRGTPLLPPNLNFFNTASIVDTNGQVHEIKSESPKNGPIDTSVISKSGTGSSDRPFIAFGVRKRADPIVISRQMEKKRRHALALQALRRKYQEQKMAKIRAVTISKLSERPSNRVTVRTNSIPKVEKTPQTVSNKPQTEKKKIKIISTKHIKVVPKSVRSINSKIKPRMCLRSFRGRFVQQELPFRAVKKSLLPEKTKNLVRKKDIKTREEKSNAKPSGIKKDIVAKKPNIGVKKRIVKSDDINIRVTRANKVLMKPNLNSKPTVKRRILIPSRSTLVKPRVLRSQTMKNSNIQSRLSRRCLNRGGQIAVSENVPKRHHKMVNPVVKSSQNSEKIIKAVKIPSNNLKKSIKEPNPDVSRVTRLDKLKVSESSDRILRNNVQSPPASRPDRKNVKPTPDVKKEPASVVKKESTKLVEQMHMENKTAKKSSDKSGIIEDQKIPEKSKTVAENKKEIDKKINPKKPVKPIEIHKMKKSEIDEPQAAIKKVVSVSKDQTSSQRPHRKTKEAAAIYMEILSHKLVNENKKDDDNISIDSFPELPNAKRTEQREIELKAKANITTKSDRICEKHEPNKDEGTQENTSRKKENISEDRKMETGTVSDDIEPKPKIPKLQAASKDKKEGNESPNPDLPENAILITKIYAKKEGKTKLSKEISEVKPKNEEIEVEKIDMDVGCVLIKNEMKKSNSGDEIISVKKIQKETSKSVNTEVKEDIGAVKIEKNIEAVVDVKAKHELLKQQNKKLSETKQADSIKKISEKKITEDIIPSTTPKNSSDSDECLAKLPLKLKKDSGIQKKNVVKQIDQELLEKEVNKSNKQLSEKPVKKTEKEVANPKNNQELSSDSDNECLANLTKGQEFKSKALLSAKRQTRLNSQKNVQMEVDSEDSFHLDVKVPRKKLLTRSRSSKLSVSSKNKSSKCDMSTPEKTDECIPSKNLLKPNVNRKSSTCDNTIKANLSFCDSDEEPLSKLTSLKKNEEKSTEELKEDILRKQKALIESPPQKNKTKKLTKQKEQNTVTEDKPELEVAPPCIGKPKRECAKRPSNYLPMFSSSDDEEKFFHGFSSKVEKKKESLYSHSSLDFLSKDLGRRFGKEKVNMSNEQIQKWLKDSAMAEDDTKKEVEFCQEIPTVTSLNSNTVIDTDTLKNTLLEVDNKEVTPEKKNSPSRETELKSPVYKSPSDRKPIFKKERVKAAPAVGAFSANNESSIYAFEEEVEDALSTPFRRPARRPSSTATSKSEDELCKVEDQSKTAHFRKPTLRNESIKTDEQKSKTKEIESSVKRTQSTSQKQISKPAVIRNASGKSIKRTNSDQLDKVPSSPSASSSSSAKLYKKPNKHKVKSVETCNAVKMKDFPCNGPGEMVEALTFYPTEKEFQDPLEYIEKISATAEQFGICRIVPPNAFKPECKVSDDMRFTSYNQYVHKMLHRWGPNFKELMAIKKYLQTQNINLTQAPWIGGMEIDLPRLYQTVQSLGGLKEVIEKEKWSKVSDIMRIPKSAQDRVTKLDDIYCKYLLPYDTLSPDEREKLLDEVETAWATRESKALLKMQKNADGEPENGSDSESDNEIEECITKGRNMNLNTFFRIARNTMSMWFKNSEPSVQEIEQEFWKHVVFRQHHICVHSGSIDSGSWGYGFAVSKNSPFARHAWNLKVLTNNSGSVLRSLGPVMGVTVPTLHVGMVFSGCCWYRDPHSLPWVEYLHTGGNKIWYGIPNSVGDLFQKTLTKLVPNYCRNQGIWLPSDTVMLPPSLLIESGVSLSRTVQEPGQFIVVFPKAFTSSISTGYVVSESVFFAPPSWLKSAQTTFSLLRDSCEPSMFSLDRLYLSIINDQRTSVEVLKQMIPIVSTIHLREKTKRENIQTLGVKKCEVLPPLETPNARKKKKSHESGDYECEICRMSLFISMIVDDQDDAIYCLDHAIEQIEKKIILPENCKLLYTYSEEDIDKLIAKINSTIEQKLQKKVFNKFSGMPTLLNRQN